MVSCINCGKTLQEEQPWRQNVKSFLFCKDCSLKLKHKLKGRTLEEAIEDNKIKKNQGREDPTSDC